MASPTHLAFRWRQSLSPAEVRLHMSEGAVCVRYEYVASLIFLTFRWESRVHLVRHDISTYFRAIPYTLFTCIFGWWGLPWGVIESAKAIWTNLGGGSDVTDEIEASLDEQ